MLERLGRDRLLQERRARRTARPRRSSSSARDDVHRDVTRRRIVLQPIEQHPAVEVGQAEVERDRVGLDARAPARAPAWPLVATTPLKPDARAISSIVIANVRSSSTTSSTRSPGSSVVVVVGDRARERAGARIGVVAIGCVLEQVSGCVRSMTCGSWRSPAAICARARASSRCLYDRRQVQRERAARPDDRSTRRSPPSRPAISREIARPRPVPPYLRLVEPSACWNASKISRCLSCGMPMPVSVTANAMTSLPRARPMRSLTRPRLGELDRVRQQVAQHLARAACRRSRSIAGRSVVELDARTRGPSPRRPGGTSGRRSRAGSRTAPDRPRRPSCRTRSSRDRGSR